MSRCAPERSTTTPRAGGSSCRCPLVVQAHEDEVGPARERLVVRHERRRLPGAVARQAGVERAPPPARQASPSRARTRSSSGCASTRSSVSCPEYPEAPTIAVYTITLAYYAEEALECNCASRIRSFSRTAPSSRQRRRCARRRVRRDLLHDRDGGLRGSRHRSQLRGAGAHVLATRSSGTTASTTSAWSRAGSGPRESSRGAAGPAFAGWLAGAGSGLLSRTSIRGRRPARPRARARCAARSVEAEPDELLDAGARRAAHRLRARARRARAGTPAARARSQGRASRTRVGAGPRVAVMDFGCKRSIVRRLAGSGLEVVGRARRPGTPTRFSRSRPAPCSSATARAIPRSSPMRSRRCAICSAARPLFGVCLGHQLLGLALGLRTFKLPFGHRGANHPVRVRGSSRVLVTVQNHGFAVEASDAAEVSHVSLNDGTVEGLEGDGFASLQFHPEASPGPLDALPFFDQVDRSMPRRTDLRSILIVGSGPIRIGQACEFDYSGSQACRVLRAEGYRVVLVNSNPATIMTDPDWADATYIEPLDADALAQIVERERPDALLPTLGGQTALNLAVELAGSRRARPLRRRADRRRRSPRSSGRRIAGSSAMRWSTPGSPCRRASSFARSTSFRPASRLRSSGRRSRSAARAAGSPATSTSSGARSSIGLRASPIGEVLVERSVEGWQEFELEVMADRAGTASSSARSRTSIRWASTRATRGPSPRSRRSRTRVPAAAGGRVRLCSDGRGRDGRRQRPVRLRAGDAASSSSSR